MAHDPAAYGRNFADVYDEWYPDAPVRQIVQRLGELTQRGARVLELGVGTGRLALPLAAAGFEVSGIDSSAEMLAILAAKPGGSVIAVTHGDAAARGSLPRGPFSLVLAAYNLMFNLANRDAQSSCFREVAEVLSGDGALVVEAFVPAPLEASRELVTRSVGDESVVLIATETDPPNAAVRGAHIELSNNGVRVRPWRICVASPDELDAMATAAGLELAERHASWAGETFVPGSSDHHVSVYRPAQRSRTLG